MDRVRWHEHEGRPWLLVDYSAAPSEQLLAIAEESVRVLLGAPDGTPIVVDVSDSVPTKEFLYYIRQANHTVMAPKQIRTAVLGVTGVKAAILRGFNAASNVKARPCRTLDDALRWLFPA